MSISESPRLLKRLAAGKIEHEKWSLGRRIRGNEEVKGLGSQDCVIGYPVRVVKLRDLGQRGEGGRRNEKNSL